MHLTQNMLQLKTHILATMTRVTQQTPGGTSTCRQRLFSQVLRDTDRKAHPLRLSLPVTPPAKCPAQPCRRPPRVCAVRGGECTARPVWLAIRLPTRQGRRTLPEGASVTPGGIWGIHAVSRREASKRLVGCGGRRAQGAVGGGTGEVYSFTYAI